MTSPLSATCHCGAVHVQIARAPDFIFECNCSLCDSPPAVAKKVAAGFSSATASIEYPAWWGYYDPSEVGVTGATRGYGRVDRETPAVEVHFCPRCGCTTHFALAEAYLEKSGVANDRMGVNMRLFDRAALSGVKLHYPDGKGWNGIGEWGYVREAVEL